MISIPDIEGCWAGESGTHWGTNEQGASEQWTCFNMQWLFGRHDTEAQISVKKKIAFKISFLIWC